MYGRESLAGTADRSVALGPLRPLALALAASLVLHALVLVALPILTQSIRAPARPPLKAQLLAKSAAPEPARLEPAPQRPRQPPPAPRSVAVAKKAARPAVAPEPLAVTPAQSVEPSKQAAEPAPAPQAPLALAAPAPGPAPVAAASGPDPGSIARYRLELMEIARRYKRYPRIAQDNHWEGRTNLRVAFAENGSIASLTVKQGAGRAVLDEAAQSMVRSAQAQAVVPADLRGKAFAFDIAVDFLLREEK